MKQHPVKSYNTHIILLEFFISNFKLFIEPNYLHLLL